MQQSCVIYTVPCIFWSLPTQMSYTLHTVYNYCTIHLKCDDWQSRNEQQYKGIATTQG